MNETPGIAVNGEVLERLWSSVEAAAARICAEGASRERLRNSVELAAAAAFRACGRGECEACERIWGGRGVPCEKRKRRQLTKRIVMTLLPMMRRGCPVETARAAVEMAVAGALGAGD